MARLGLPPSIDIMPLIPPDPPPDIGTGRTAFINGEHDIAGALFGIAQIWKGPRWFFPRSYNMQSLPYQQDLWETSAAMDIENFANVNLSMVVLNGSSVSFRYKFQNFRGTIAVFSGWEGKWETHCQELVTNPQNTSNIIKDLKDLGIRYEWAVPDYLNPSDSAQRQLIPRDEKVDICKSSTSNPLCFKDLGTPELNVVVAAVFTYSSDRAVAE